MNMRNSDLLIGRHIGIVHHADGKREIMKHETRMTSRESRECSCDMLDLRFRLSRSCPVVQLS